MEESLYGKLSHSMHKTCRETCGVVSPIPRPSSSSFYCRTGLIAKFDYCVCLFLAALRISSAQIACRGGLLIEYVCESKVCEL